MVHRPRSLGLSSNPRPVTWRWVDDSVDPTLILSGIIGTYLGNWLENTETRSNNLPWWLCSTQVREIPPKDRAGLSPLGHILIFSWVKLPFFRVASIQFRWLATVGGRLFTSPFFQTYLGGRRTTLKSRSTLAWILMKSLQGSHF